MNSASSLVSRAVFFLLPCVVCVGMSAQTLWVPGDTDGIGDNTINSNVGIGTNAPSGKLEIKAAASVNFLQLTNSSNSDRYSRWGHDNEGAYVQVGNNGDSISFRSSSGNSLVYLNPNNGNVGIGTTTPGHLLEVGSSNTNVYAGAGAGGYPTIGTAYGAGAYMELYNGATGVTNIVNNSYPIALTSGGAERMRIGANGNVGIGTSEPGIYKLAVKGKIRAEEIVVETGWADYVFADDYRLAPLAEVEAHIRENKHLPGIPSAAEVEQGGVSLGDMQAKLLAKIEELTLHQIALEKRLVSLEQENTRLRQQP